MENYTNKQDEFVYFGNKFVQIKSKNLGVPSKKPSIFTDIVQIEGREVNPISKKLKDMICTYSRQIGNHHSHQLGTVFLFPNRM